MAFPTRPELYPKITQLRRHMAPSGPRRDRRIEYTYRSVKATSRELKTGLNIYRMIDFEPV
jgi:hypothetical protein